MDPAAVEALARQIHQAECLPGASPQTAWSQAHHDRDEAKAARIIAGLENAGYQLAPVASPEPAS